MKPKEKQQLDLEKFIESIRFDDIEVERKAQVLSLAGFRGPSALYRAIAEGRFTRAIKFGPRVAGWLGHERQAITAARAAGGSDEQIGQLVAHLHAMRTSLFDRLERAK